MSTPTSSAVCPSWPASLQVLLGEPAPQLWGAALGPLGGRLRTLTPSTVTLRPDGAATVRWSAAVDWTDGRTTTESLAATTGAEVPPGAAVVEGPGPDGRPVAVGLWRWPLDPALPGLAWAASAAATAIRLRALDIDAGSPRLRLRAYRPGRRAVVEVNAPGGRWFLKVVRPAALPGLVARHEALAAAVPTEPNGSPDSGSRPEATIRPNSSTSASRARSIRSSVARTSSRQVTRVTSARARRTSSRTQPMMRVRAARCTSRRRARPRHPVDVRSSVLTS